jgi:hypothetical protein
MIVKDLPLYYPGPKAVRRGINFNEGGKYLTFCAIWWTEDDLYDPRGLKVLIRLWVLGVELVCWRPL